MESEKPMKVLKGSKLLYTSHGAQQRDDCQRTSFSQTQDILERGKLALSLNCSFVSETKSELQVATEN